MGYQSMPVQAPIETSALMTGTAINLNASCDDVKSKDEDEPLAPAQGVSLFFFIPRCWLLTFSKFTSFTLQPIIKTTISTSQSPTDSCRT